MFSAQVGGVQPRLFLSCYRQHRLGSLAQRKVKRSRELFSTIHCVHDLLADRLYFGERTNEFRRKSFIFSHQATQKVVRTNLCAAQLTGFIPCEEEALVPWADTNS